MVYLEIVNRLENLDVDTSLILKSILKIYPHLSLKVIKKDKKIMKLLQK